MSDEILKEPQPGERIYDPTVGTGGMLISALAQLKHGAATPAVVNDIDEIVRIVRFDGWQSTHASEREVRNALRRTLLKYKLHQDQELFERAYGYVRTYY